MRMKNLIEKYNSKDTIGIISPYYSKNRGDFRGYSIARYTHLLCNAFPANQKIVIFCEKDKKFNTFYEASGNILVAPTYKFNSLSFSSTIIKNIKKFNLINNVLMQFEFSIYGGKKVIPGILHTLFILKLMNKNISITLHQAVTNLNELSGHLGLSKNSLQTSLLNSLMFIFYKIIGILSDKIIVHDNLLKVRLANFIDKNKIEVIPHAIGDENVKKLTPKLIKYAKNKFGFTKKDKVVTVYGYRSWYKGTDWIVKTVKEINDTNPDSNIKLLIAGGVSPTLNETSSYKNFDRKLKGLIKLANGSVKITGFIPEKDVCEVFAASDVIVFPYRTRMSASGAFSLALAYKKPFLVSNHFAVGSEIDLKKFSFDLNTNSFSKALSKIAVFDSSNLINSRSWEKVANLYLNTIKNATIKLDENSTEKAVELA